MAKRRSPRHGSMQFWPRVRAKKETPRVRSYAQSSEAKPLEFAGFKAGMTHIHYTDAKKTSLTKGSTVVAPVTIIECPPIVVIGVRFYKKVDMAMQVVAQVTVSKYSQEVKKRVGAATNPSKITIESVSVGSYDEIRLLVATQPKMAGFGKKVADVFEMGIGGDKAAQAEYAKSQLGQVIAVADVLKQGDFVDTHAVTSGKGYQGPVKRFGVNLRAKKSEKTKRGPGSLGPWKGQGHIMYRVPQAGQMGYNLRTDYNKEILFVGEDLSKVNPAGGLVRYGEVKTTYVLVRGSVSGPKKRLVRMTSAIRPNKRLVSEIAAVEHISTRSQQ